jgi:hypothetical protein
MALHGFYGHANRSERTAHTTIRARAAHGVVHSLGPVRPCIPVAQLKALKDVSNEHMHATGEQGNDSRSALDTLTQARSVLCQRRCHIVRPLA